MPESANPRDSNPFARPRRALLDPLVGRDASANQLEADDPEEKHSPNPDPEQIAGVLALFDQLEGDSKWERCAELITEALAQGHRYVVIFSDFRDTATYLAGLCGGLDCHVELMTADQTMQTKAATVQQFREEGGVLIVSDSDGPSLNFTTYCIHYDWSTSSMLSRLGRIHRLSKGGHPATVKHCFLVDELTSNSSALHKALNLD